MGTSVFNRLTQWGRPLPVAPLCHPEWAHIPVATASDSEVTGGVHCKLGPVLVADPPSGSALPAWQ
jgi:hypothetical protein